MRYIQVTDQLFDPQHEIMLLQADNPSIGGIVSFIGLMRDFNAGDRVQSMFLEHYPGMTEKALETIVTEAFARWDLIGCRVVHRVGELHTTDPIVLVAVASAHRGEAFRACEFIIDYLKTRAPFWKKETIAEGQRWVEARQSDQESEAKWRK